MTPFSSDANSSSVHGSFGSKAGPWVLGGGAAVGVSEAAGVSMSIESLSLDGVAATALARPFFFGGILL